MAAWQSANSLLQELHFLQQQQPFGSQAPAHEQAAAAASLHHHLLLPAWDQRPGKQAHPLWLHDVMAQHGGGSEVREACSPERHLAAASEAATATAAMHPHSCH